MEQRTKGFDGIQVEVSIWTTSQGIQFATFINDQNLPISCQGHICLRLKPSKPPSGKYQTLQWVLNLHVCVYDEYSRNSGKFYPLRYTRTFDIICLIVAGRRQVTSQRLTNTFILNWFHVTKMLIPRCHINFFDNSFRLTSEKRPRLRFTGPLRWWPVDFSHKETVTTLQSRA